MYFFPEGLILYSNQAIVVANQSVEFEALYGFKPDIEVFESDPDVPNMQKDSSWSSGSMNLSASGDDVLLLDDQGLLVDGVSWGSSTAILDPSVADVAPDHAIERYPPSTDTDLAADWRDQPVPIPGQVDHSIPTSTPTPTSTATPTNTVPPTALPDLLINEIHADPDAVLGDANGDGIVDTSDDEFIEIVNTTQDTIDIGGWEIHDLTGVRHVFTDTLLIPAGSAVLVFAGGIPKGDFGNAIVQISSTGILGLNNTGDTITLYDLNMTVVNAYTYGYEGGDNQSLTRDPDITGIDPMIKHSEAANSNGALFSPGTMVDGSYFVESHLKSQQKQYP
jgi:hypothetical protein